MPLPQTSNARPSKPLTRARRYLKARLGPSSLLLLGCSGAGGSPTTTLDSGAITDRSSIDAGENTDAVSAPPCSEWRNNSDPERLFEPPSVPNVALDGISGSLTLYASTLTNGPGGLALYAAICNESASTLCSAALQVEFYDHDDALIGTASGAVQSGRLFRFSQSPYPVSCVEPGQTAMAALTTLPPGLAVNDLKSMGHRFPAFVIDEATPLAGVTVSQVESFQVADGAAFRGVVTNNADSPMSNPEVSVFPIAANGRPLGNGTSSGLLVMQPGGTWAFETNSVAEAGSNRVAFAAATFIEPPQTTE